LCEQLRYWVIRQFKKIDWLKSRIHACRVSTLSYVTYNVFIAIKNSATKIDTLRTALSFA